MKISKITIKSLFGIKEWSGDGKNIELVGDNGTGKTSVIDAIRYALTNASDREYIIKNGETEGEIFIETDSGLSIDRKPRQGMTDYKSVKQNGNVVPSPETFLKTIFTPLQLSPMSDVVASDKKFIRMENGALTVIAGVLIAVGNSVFKTEKTTLTASNLDGTASKFEVGKDYCIYICDPTGGDATNFATEQYRISLNTTYPNGYTAVTSRKIGGFHYGVVRKTNSSGIPISASGAALGSGWETNVTEGIVPNSVWTLLHRPTCDPTGMVYIGPFWGDIYLSSDNGASGLQSKKGVVPITGTEGLNWYIANERAMRVGKRLPTYAEFCKGAYGSPQGEDGNNTYAWSATSNTARTACGNVKNAVSATNVRDLVGNVWKWLDEFIHDPTGSAWNWYDVMSGQKVGQLYMANNTGLHALIGGGSWGDGVHGGSRAVSCISSPWNVYTYVGVWCVCDSL